MPLTGPIPEGRTPFVPIALAAQAAHRCCYHSWKAANTSPNKVIRNEDKRTSCLPGLALLEACRRASVLRTNMSPKGNKFQHRQVRLVERAWAVELCCPAAPITLAGRFSPRGPRGMDAS